MSGLEHFYRVKCQCLINECIRQCRWQFNIEDAGTMTMTSLCFHDISLLPFDPNLLNAWLFLISVGSNDIFRNNYTFHTKISFSASACKTSVPWMMSSHFSIQTKIWWLYIIKTHCHLCYFLKQSIPVHPEICIDQLSKSLIRLWNSTHRSLNKMAVILETPFPNTVSKYIFVFVHKFQSFSSWSNQWYVTIGSGNGLALNMQQTITWTDDAKVHWHI